MNNRAECVLPKSTQTLSHRALSLPTAINLSSKAAHDPVLERYLIETVPVQVTYPHRQEVILIVLPVTRRIDLVGLARVLSAKRAEFIPQSLMQQCFGQSEPLLLLPFADSYADTQVYYASELQTLTQIQFCQHQLEQRVFLTADDFFARAGRVRWLELPTVAKYKIEVAQIFPEQQRDVLLQKRHCMLGFSLQSQSFMPAKLAGMAEWISKHFSECSVLVGDGIHRITLEINGMSKTQAVSHALSLGQAVIEQDASIFQSYQSQCRFHLISTAAMQTTPDYFQYYQSLTHLFEHDEKFHASVNAFATNFVGERRLIDADSLAYFKQLSCQYLLEEIALTAILLSQGVTIFVYPGTLRIMQELSLGEHPGVPSVFNQLVSINLRQKRR